MYILKYFRNISFLIYKPNGDDMKLYIYVYDNISLEATLKVHR